MTKLTATALLVLTTSALAAPKKAAEPAVDTAVLVTELDYFVGTWRCKETWSKSPINEAYESTSTLVATDTTDSVWVAWSYVQDPSPKNKNPIKGNDIWGYDPAKKQYIRVKVDNFAPGVMSHLTSKGFVDDTITWEGSIDTPKGPIPFKHAFKKLDKKTIEGKLFLGDQAFYSSKCTKR